MPANIRLSEEDLAARMLKGDTEAFEILYERYFPRLCDLAFHALGDPDLAQDVAQEAFRRLLERRPRRPPRHFRAYLYTIARHEVVNLLRRSRRHIPLSHPTLESPEEGPLPEAPAVEEGAIRAERNRLLSEALRGLDPEEALLLDLRFRQGLEAAELAQIFGTSIGAIHTRLSRALDRLEEALTAWVLWRHGPADCPGLTAIRRSPEAASPTLTPGLRRTLARHARECARCEEARRRHLTTAEWMGAVAPWSPDPETAQRIRRSLQERLAALAGAAAAAPAFGFLGSVPFRILAGVSLAGLGLALAGTLWLLQGAVTIRVENVDCPPLHLPAGVASLIGRWPGLELPAVIPPGRPQTMRLPPMAVTVSIAQEEIRVRADGLPWPLVIRGPARVTWDGQSLGEGTHPLVLRPGSAHALRIACPSP